MAAASAPPAPAPAPASGPGPRAADALEPSAARAAAGAGPRAPAAVPGPAEPPTVVIEQIQVITPPARAPEADPFASLAAVRAGDGRHAGGAR